MKCLRIFFAIFLWSANSSLLGQIVQSGSYALSSTPFAWDSSGSSTPILLMDDRFSGAVTLPFPFCFYGQNFQTLWITDNGFITFHDPGFNANVPWMIPTNLPSSDAYPISIFAPWQDLNPSPTTLPWVFWHISGSSPNRKFVVSWENVLYLGSWSTTYAGQIQLFESSHIIELHIKRRLATLPGILGISAHDFRGDAVPGRTRTAPWTTQNEAWRFVPLETPCGSPAAGGQLGGKVYYDLNGNCAFNAGDHWLSDFPIRYATLTGLSQTDSSGSYAAVVPSGLCQIEALPHPRWQVNCPGSGTYQGMSIAGVSALNHYFTLTGPACADLWADLSAYQILPCTTQAFSLSYGNQGVLPADSAVLLLDLGDSLQIAYSPIPYTPLGGGQYSFSVGTIAPGKRVSLPIFVSVGCAPANSLHCFSASISSQTSGECDTINNTLEECLRLQSNPGGNALRISDREHPSRTWVISDTIQADQSIIFKLYYEYPETQPLHHFIASIDFSPYLELNSLTFLGGNLAITPFFSAGKVHFQALPTQGNNGLPKKGFIKFRANPKANWKICDDILSKAKIEFNQTLLHYSNSITAYQYFIPALNWPTVVCNGFVGKPLYGFPPDGEISGPGVSTGLNPLFHSSIVGPGTYSIRYQWYCGSRMGENFFPITVIPNTQISWNQSFPTLCREDTARILLYGGSPTGGYYSGLGVSGNYLYPANLPAGNSAIRYNYPNTIPACNTFNQKKITIHPEPDTPSIYFLPPNQGVSAVWQDSLQWFINGIMAGWSSEFITLTTPGIYTLKVYENNCPSAHSNPIEWLLTNQATPMEKDWTVGPNPAQHWVSITPPNPNRWQLYLYDAQGTLQLQRNQLIGAQTIDLSGVPNGSYLIILHQNGQEKSIMVQVQH